MTVATRPLRLGTRRSALALAQSDAVGAALTGSSGRPVELVEVLTQGDRSAAAITTLGGTGVFVTALRERLRAGEVDLAVHSLKDLPTAAVPDLVIAAVPPRQDPADVLVAAGGARLAELPSGATVGTGAPRRAAQLRALGRGLHVVPVRGNVDTRLRRVGVDLDAVVLARAGLARLGRLDPSVEVLPPEVMMPAPGQGALAVECRADDDEILAALAALDHAPSRAAVTAERALLAGVEAGCTAPVGALATCVDGELRLDAVAAAPDGARVLRMSATGPLAEAAATGRRLAAALLAAGAADLLRESE